MVSINDLKKEEIEKSITGKIKIYGKCYGNKITLQFENGIPIFLKSKNRPITKLDLLISDLYETPINTTLSNIDKFDTSKKYQFTYDYRTKKLVCDDFFIKCDGITNNNMLFDGVLDDKTKSDFVNNYQSKIFNKFGKDKTCLIIKNDGGKSLFKIVNNRYTTENEKLPIYFIEILKLVINDIDICKLQKIIIDDIDPINIYQKIIDKIFISSLPSLKSSGIEILNVPYYLKQKNIKNKSKYIDKSVFDEIVKDHNLFYIYTFLLSQFNKPTLPYDELDVKTKEKFELINNKITEICDGGIFNIELPTFDEIIK